MCCMCFVICFTCQILHWAASDFGTDIGRCEFYGPIQNEEESIKVTQKSLQRLDPPFPYILPDDIGCCARINSGQKSRNEVDLGCRGENILQLY